MSHESESGLRLATVRDGTRDGTLLVLSHDGTRGVPAPVPNLRSALEDWETYAPELVRIASSFDDQEADTLDLTALASPLPRAFQWCEGSTYLAHMERCRAARGAALPPDHGVSPAVLQAGSDRFLAPTDVIPLGDVSWDLDIEATVAVVVGDVPSGVSADDALSYVRLVVLVNDLTFRSLLAKEFAIGVGFYQAKPARIFAPIARTPASLGAAWTDGLLHANVRCWVNDRQLGDLDTAADAAFNFGEIIEHAALTRPLAAGTVIGSGTISNRDERRGFGCLAEQRALEIRDHGSAITPFLVPGDRVKIEAFDADCKTLFGSMENAIVAG
jgi:fumarylacetoacetate (FAA) hydrolase